MTPERLKAAYNLQQEIDYLNAALEGWERAELPRGYGRGPCNAMGLRGSAWGRIRAIAKEDLQQQIDAKRKELEAL